jgi:hypothetical protein
MKGQGSSALKILLTGFIALNFALGCGLGVEAVIRGAPSLWRIADLFFDYALLSLMLARAPALLKS